MQFLDLIVKIKTELIYILTILFLITFIQIFFIFYST